MAKGLQYYLNLLFRNIIAIVSTLTLYLHKFLPNWHSLQTTMKFYLWEGML